MSTVARKRRGVNKGKRRAVRATYVVASAAARGAKENTYKSAAEKAEREFRAPTAPNAQTTPKDKPAPKPTYQCTKCSKMLQKGLMAAHHKRFHPTAPAPGAAPPTSATPNAKDFLELMKDSSFLAELTALVATA
jgi:hypothetical protein